MGSNYREVPCAVTHELVVVVADSDEVRFKDYEGNLLVGKILKSLGFRVNTGFITTPNQYVRYNENPSLVLLTEAVYSGLLIRGHELASTYRRLEVLHQPIVDPALLLRGEDIGDSESYNKER